MVKINRRAFCNVALGTVLATDSSDLSASPKEQESGDKADAPVIVDTNVSLGAWPFRHLKYEGSQALGEKLKKHRVRQAWAGSFDALFHKNIDAVNEKLALECASYGNTFFLPFGTVNLAWPDWQEDVRRCQELYGMKGIRIYPSYQTFDLADQAFPALLEEVTRRKMILQIVGDMDDSRNHHPVVEVRHFSYAPLVDLLKRSPQSKVQLLYWNHRVSAKLMDDLVANTNILFDTARIETAGGIEAMLEGNSGHRDRVFRFGGMERTVGEIPWSRVSGPVPAERIAFGSHAPYFPVEASLLKLFESELTMQQTRSIMETNAREFLTT